jgi:hypothetical protein
MPANTSRLNDSAGEAATIKPPFLIKHAALQDFSDCLFNTCRVMIDAANALNVNGNAELKDLKRQALILARKAAKHHAKCQERPESEARAMIKGKLFKIWIILDRISRALIVDTESKLLFRDMVNRTVEEIDDCVMRNSKSNMAILDNLATEG